MSLFANAIDQLFSLKDMLLNTDWESNMVCPNPTFDPMSFLQISSDVFQGNLNLPFVEPPPIDENCSIPAETVVGPYIGRGMCIGIQLMCVTGIIGLIQFVMNVFLVIMFVLYLKSKVDALAGA